MNRQFIPEMQTYLEESQIESYTKSCDHVVTLILLFWILNGYNLQSSLSQLKGTGMGTLNTFLM